MKWEGHLILNGWQRPIWATRVRYHCWMQISPKSVLKYRSQTHRYTGGQLNTNYLRLQFFGDYFFIDWSKELLRMDMIQGLNLAGGTMIRLRATVDTTAICRIINMRQGRSVISNLDVLDLTWLMPCRSEWSIGHSLLFSIEFCLELPPPSSPSCTWILLSSFLTPDLFSKYSVVALFFRGFYCKACLAMLLVFTLHKWNIKRSLQSSKRRRLRSIDGENVSYSGFRNY